MVSSMLREYLLVFGRLTWSSTTKRKRSRVMRSLPFFGLPLLLLSGCVLPSGEWEARYEQERALRLSTERRLQDQQRYCQRLRATLADLRSKLKSKWEARRSCPGANGGTASSHPDRAGNSPDRARDTSARPARSGPPRGEVRLADVRLWDRGARRRRLRVASDLRKLTPKWRQCYLESG